MATHTINPDTSALKSVRVERSPALSRIFPSVAVGDQLRFTVRQNSPDGKGSITLHNNQIAAQLPNNIRPGDSVTAEVAALDDAIVLKIVSVNQSTTTNATKALIDQVLGQLQENGRFARQGLIAFPFPETPEIANLASLLQVNLSDVLSTEVETKLKGMGNGDFIRILKEAAESLRQQGDTLLPQSMTKILLLVEDLNSLLAQSSEKNTIVKRVLSELVKEITDFSKSGVSKNTPTEKLLESTLSKLVRPDISFDELKEIISQLYKSLDFSKLKGNEKSNVDNLSNQFQQLATRFEQLAATQERLNQFNPIMNALGEAVFILFPHILDGHLNHVEVRTNFDQHNQKKKEEDEETESNSDETDGDSFKRVQLKVPLPNLGTVLVDIAHRESELFARFSLREQEAGKFILQQLEHLAAMLRGKGYEKAELVANVSEQNSDEFAASLYSGQTSVKA